MYLTVDKFKLKYYIKFKKKKSLIGHEARYYYHLFEKTLSVVMCNVIINLGIFFRLKYCLMFRVEFRETESERAHASEAGK